MSDLQSHPNTRCVRKACDALGILYKTHDAYGNFVAVGLDPIKYFVNASAPFNNGAIDKICRDKAFSYRLLKDAVRTPRTKGYFDPYPEDPQYQGYVVEQSYEAIADAIVQEFSLPVIVKMNSGLKGRNVYLCEDRSEVLAAIETIFNHKLPSSDYVALAQEYVPPTREYRTVVFKGEVVLVYEKDLSDATFTGNLSPFHYEGARAVPVEDAVVTGRIQGAVDGIFPVLDLEFGGIDLIEDEAGELHVIELNTHPGFSYFVRDNGDQALVAMYEYILRQLRR
ncbi:MAG TPA: alpha-L-glutamate ligase [Candidatus Paceibacterota bacterium]|nr:alpha-L-glutamate ligase [Candidatus Paceibacterota bacterium]